MFGLGPWEIGLILLVILLLFGGKRLPELARSLGKGLREFKKAFTENQQEDEGKQKNDDSGQSRKKDDPY